MKKQLNPTIKAHLIRSAFYVLLLARGLRDSIRAGAAKHGPPKRDQFKSGRESGGPDIAKPPAYVRDSK